MSPQSRRNVQKGPNWGVIGVVVGTLVFLAVVAVVLVSLAGSDGDEPAQPAEGALPTFSGGTDPAVGQQAPPLVAAREEGGAASEIELSEEGVPVALFFLAHWCPHCQAELPRLVELNDQGAFEGVRTIAVMTSTDPTAPNYPPDPWLASEGWEGVQVHDTEDNQAATDFGLDGFPYMVFLNADGTVSQRLSGEQTPESVTAAVDATRG